MKLPPPHDTADSLARARAALGSSDSVERADAAEALAEARDALSAPAIRALLSDPDPISAFRAAVALSVLGDDAGVEVLVWALDKRDLCFEALRGLTRLAAPAALEPVQRFFARRWLHPLERLQAAAALHVMGDASGTAHLERCQTSTRAEERGFALELAGALRLPGALELLRGVLEDERDIHRLDAARGLSLLGDARAIPVLERTARDPSDPELAALAQQALQEFLAEKAAD
ncbi:MAG: HEAT repeat domain-containing protein [Myxococcales bacterium]|nr:HEAT repeat domain-containing protein [Myxococcales bacterium]